MRIDRTSAVGFGIIIKDDDREAAKRVNQFCENRQNPFNAVAEVLEIFGYEHLMVEIAGSTLVGYRTNDLVLIVKDTYRDIDMMSSGFSGAFIIGEDGINAEGVAELQDFCAKMKIEFETAASWITWNTAS